MTTLKLSIFLFFFQVSRLFCQIGLAQEKYFGIFRNPFGFTSSKQKFLFTVGKVFIFCLSNVDKVDEITAFEHKSVPLQDLGLLEDF